MGRSDAGRILRPGDCRATSGFPYLVTDVPRPALATLSYRRFWDDGWVCERELPAEDTGLRQDSKAQAEQVRSVDVRRLIQRVSRLPVPLTHAVDDALRLHLDLD